MEEIEIVFIEVKTGGSVLSARERAVKKAVEQKRLSWRVFNPDVEVDHQKSLITAEDQRISPHGHASGLFGPAQMQLCNAGCVSASAACSVALYASATTPVVCGDESPAANS
jgi:hypothetical protein